MMTEEKKACLDEWIWIKYRRYYLELGYKIYKDYKRIKYFVIHPWDLKKNSHEEVNVTCPGYGTRKVTYRNYYKYKSPLPSIKVKKSDIFKYLTIIKSIEKRSSGNLVWECLCKCGNTCYITSDHLTSGNTKSCGCYKKELILQRHRDKGNFVKEDHTPEEIYKYLEKQNDNTKTLCHFNKQFAKDNKFLCELTNKNEWGNISVHHLYSRNTHPELSHELSNLVCIRKDLHLKFHKEFGFGNNTPNQFELFKKEYRNE